jgi:hypothetical protein
MNILTLIQEAFAFIQAIEPGVKSAQEVGAVIGPVVVKALYLGRQLKTYLVTRRAEEDEEPLAQVEAEGAEAEPLSPGMPTITKPDVALLVDINRRMFHDVSRYLDAQGIDADIVILTNDPAYSDAIQFLPADDPEVWTELVQDFNAAINSIKRMAGAARVHIFLSTPLALTFGLGSVWGTVDNATIYHWQDGTYHPAMRISRTLRAAPDA